MFASAIKLAALWVAAPLSLPPAPATAWRW